MPQTTVWRVLRKCLWFKPYRLQLFQALGPADYNSREAFRLVSSDECTFHLNGKVNCHNIKEYSTENLHTYVQFPQDQYILAHFEQYGLWSIHLRRRYCEQDFISWYAAIVVDAPIRKLTKHHFSARWSTPSFCVSCKNIPQPMLSQQMDWQRITTNMTITFTWFDTLDFFAWGFIKSWVYKIEVRDLQDLKNCIWGTVVAISGNMLTKVFRAALEHWTQCFEMDGSHVELQWISYVHTITIALYTVHVRITIISIKWIETLCPPCVATVMFFHLFWEGVKILRKHLSLSSLTILTRSHLNFFVLNSFTWVNYLWHLSWKFQCDLQDNFSDFFNWIEYIFLLWILL